jgi:hypothetical protein
MPRCRRLTVRYARPPPPMMANLDLVTLVHLVHHRPPLNRQMLLLDAAANCLDKTVIPPNAV